MPLYDVLIKRMEGTGTPGPLLAGASARMVAVLCVAPLELVRTRTQAVFAPQSLAAADCRISGTSRVWSQLSLANANLSGLGRVQQLWRGVASACAQKCVLGLQLLCSQHVCLSSRAKRWFRAACRLVLKGLLSFHHSKKAAEGCPPMHIEC